MAHPLPATTTWSEADRLAALHAYDILDSGPELAFDDLVKLAAQACAAPIAAINFIESTRQWFKAEVGLGASETTLDLSICAHTLREGGLFVVPDTTQDARFAANPLVTGEPHLRFYAGAVLATAEGLPLGTLCVLDHSPRATGLTVEQGEALLALARQVIVQLEHRRLLRRLSQREAELADSERKFRAISDSIDQMIWSTTPDGLHDFFNRRWYEFTGVPEGSTNGETWNGLFHPADQGRAWTTWHRALATGERYHIEYRLRHRSGQYRWVLGRAQPERDKLGRITRWHGTCTDIHDLKVTQEALAESETRFRTLVEVSPQVVWFGDARGEITYCNAYWYDYTGLTPDDIGEDRWASVIHPGHRERILGMWKHAAQNASSYEVEIPFRRAADGTYRWFLARGLPIRDAHGAVERWAGIALDIHERKLAEETNARLGAIVTSSTDAILSFDPGDGRIQTWNWGAEHLFGYTATEAIGAPVNLLVPPTGLPPPENETGVFDLVGTHGSVAIESRRCRKDGSVVEVAITATQVTAPDGRSLGVAATFRDITARKRLEEQQALVTRELHHRVKNTLATVQALVSSTARHARTIADFQQSVTDRITSLAKTHTLLINDAWGGADLREILRAELSPYGDDGGRRVRLEGPELHLRYEMALAMSMAAHELTTNAAKYGALSLPTGAVEVTWRLDPAEDGQRRLLLTWAERHGPPVAVPSRQGFGSVLLQRVLGRQLGGDVEISYEVEGVRVRVTAFLPQPH